MVDNDLGYRFTNEIYATKKEVANTLKVTLIDKFWTNIVEYRSHFTVKTGVRSIDDTYFSVCLAPAINEKLNLIERKINKIYKKYNVANNPGYRKEVATVNLVQCVKTLADSLMISVSEQEVRNIVNNDISAISPDKLILQKYASLLNELLNRESVSSLGALSDYLYDIVSALVPSFNESGTIYRNKSLYSQRLNYSNVYDESPVRLIEPLMNNLFSYLTSSRQGFILKIAITMFYVNYIKPFEAYNELISTLLSKYILLNNDLEGVAAFIDFESILIKDSKLTTANEETQKACDITYFLVYFCDKLNAKLDALIDGLVSIKVEEIKNEYYGIQPQNNDNIEVLTEKELKNNPFGITEEPDIFKTSYDEEETQDVAPVEPTQVEEKVEEVESSQIKLIRNPAITNLTFAYSEDEARKVEQFLTESNPNLSRPQAYFYARHCTVGKYYTIAQYKKEVGCAYETARVAMDKLVSEGYYAKEPYKNKYLYTPIKRK